MTALASLTERFRKTTASISMVGASTDAGRIDRGQTIVIGYYDQDNRELNGSLQ
jgi:hypothetical protein